MSQNDPSWPTKTSGQERIPTRGGDGRDEPSLLRLAPAKGTKEKRTRGRSKAEEKTAGRDRSVPDIMRVEQKGLGIPKKGRRAKNVSWNFIHFWEETELEGCRRRNKKLLDWGSLGSFGASLSKRGERRD